MFKAIRLALLLCLALSDSPLFAQQAPVIHYKQENGFPGHYAYYMVQDKTGYIWVGTENGLARFNGHEFKLFTTKDGLPDNEILELMEDNSGRLWFLPFCNSIGYIKNGVIHTRENDPLLSRLHFDTKPGHLTSDRFGNIMIAEPSKITCVTNTGEIKRFTVKLHLSHNSIFVFKTPKGDIQLIDTARVLYQYDNKNWKKIVQLPQLDMKICHHIVAYLGVDAAVTFFEKIRKEQNPVYFEREQLDKINFIVPLYPGKLALLRTDGCFLMDIASTKIVDTLLYGYSVSGSMIASDKSLWLCTHGHGIFRFIQSPVRSLVLPEGPSSVTYIRGQKNSMYATLGKGRYIEAGLDQHGLPGSPVIKELQPKESFSYLGKTRSGDWIGCAEKVYKYNRIGQKPVAQSSTWAIKDVLEEDSAHLLIATSFYLHRLNRDEFEVTEGLIKKRLTSIAISAGKIYAGTLEGLLVNDSGFRKVFADYPPINTHILKLCSGTDSTLWIANNKGALIGIRGGRVLAVINEQTGLQCNTITSIKVSEKFIWAGTDNGLYAIQNKAPYTIARHLTYTTGLNSSEIRCLYLYGKRVWVGTSKGINYFNEQEIFSHTFEPKLIINDISNGGSKIAVQNASSMVLSGKALAIAFDVIDHEGGQKPSYQYCINNDSSWVNLENNMLYFAKAPYGNFEISIRASSPNWSKPILQRLRFYQPYPIYLRWWFLSLAFLLLTAILLAAVMLFLKNARKKDEEKVTVQRKLLQLEQMALQGQMNPHFIFNCIAAIKQYYSSGDNARANEFVDQFSALIRQTFEMGTQLFIPLDKELNYLAQYLAIEKTRFDHTFDFSISKDISLPESSIYVPVMLLQPLAENAVRHGIRHLTDRRGKVSITIVQQNTTITISVTDNGVGRAKSKSFSQFLQNIVPLTSTTVNTKRIELLNQLVGDKITYHTQDIADEQGTVSGTAITISYPLSIHNLQP